MATTGLRDGGRYKSAMRVAASFVACLRVQPGEMVPKKFSTVDAPLHGHGAAMYQEHAGFPLLHGLHDPWQKR